MKEWLVDEQRMQANEWVITWLTHGTHVHEHVRATRIISKKKTRKKWSRKQNNDPWGTCNYLFPVAQALDWRAHSGSKNIRLKSNHRELESNMNKLQGYPQIILCKLICLLTYPSEVQLRVKTKEGRMDWRQRRKAEVGRSKRKEKYNKN